MIKKLGYSLLIVLLLTGSFYSNVEAKTPNVKDCIENEKDCSEPSSTEVSEEGNGQELDSGSNSSLFLNLVKMVFALFLVLALIYFFLKFINKRNTLHKQKTLQNLGGISVGPSKSVQIIRVGSRYYLIGVGDNVEMLKEITDETLIEEIVNDTDEKDNIRFNTFISNLLKKSETNQESTNSSEKNFKKLFSDELASLKESRNNLMEQHKPRKDSHE